MCFTLFGLVITIMKAQTLITTPEWYPGMEGQTIENQLAEVRQRGMHLTNTNRSGGVHLNTKRYYR
jgi:hypothetical protein